MPGVRGRQKDIQAAGLIEMDYRKETEKLT